MKVPFNILDFLDRAEHVYGDRVGIVDEPDQPADSWGRMTWRQVAEHARAMAAGLDALGVGPGERIAIVSHNSARLLVALFAVSGYGRVVVPINFRLNADEVRYIVEQSGASVLLVDPELDEALADVDAPHRFVLGRQSDAALLRFDRQPNPWVDPSEDAIASINYTSGTTARPKGVELTHRNLYLNALTFGWHTGVDDRDVYLWAVPMFHCNGWGLVYAITAMGGTHVMLRKVDGPEILQRIDREGVTFMGGAPAVVSTILTAAEARPGPTPGRGRMRIVVGGAPPPTAVIERVETELGWEFMQIYGLTETSPLMTLNRRRAEWDDLTPAERARQLGRAGPPAIGIKVRIDDDGEVLAHGNAVFPATGNSPPRPPRSSATDGSTPVTAAASTTTATSPSPTARRTSSSPAARTSHRSRSKTPSSNTPPSPKPPSSECPTPSGVRPSKRSSCSAPAPTPPNKNCSPTAERTSPTTSARHPSSSTAPSPAPQPARSRSSSSALRTGAGETAW